ncbi:M1 family metallopeptidase [Compostibacter hankyongensis]|uniref:M1 family metallopeptidase n=1 Tax=Compostibacter hankyongensis TaxID=1007089 RepID=A0ABP8FC34_9BACT
MNTRLAPGWLAALFLLSGLPLYGQSHYDPQKAFSPLFYTAKGTLLRNADGAPGPAYWQNRADYTVTATLDTAGKRISGQVTITYSNNSPATLRYLWLQLDQNITRKDSRSNTMQAPGVPDSGNGFVMEQVSVRQGNSWMPADYRVEDTRMKLLLERPLDKGRQLQLRITYRYYLGKSGGGGRSGYLDTRNGRVYEVSYWYPRMCVYDDIRGWNTLPFLGSGEFYLDYGDIDYRVTLPAGMIVAGSGALVNPEAVLSPAQQQRWKQASASDRTVFIRTPEEVTAEMRRPPAGTKTWHFHMKNTRDVAWAASAAFIWDAARINLPGGKQAMAMSVYPAESAGSQAWGRGTEFMKNAVEIFSQKWFVYPYPVAVNCAGAVGGMEFPGIVFDHWKADAQSLWMLTAHEIGHNWFPMIVGSNERRNAWMDEGFNTFIDIYAHEAFNNGEFAPKRDGEYAPAGGNPAEEILKVIEKPGIPPVLTTADAFLGEDDHPVEYFKTAFGLVLLREVILGPERFDPAFRQYIHDWAYKHPSPEDFFHAMENGAGEDLAWFWRGWFIHNWKLDQAVKSVNYTDGDPSRGALITLENLEQLPMPAIVKITESNGKEHTLHLPVEIWQQGREWTFRSPTVSRVTSVVLDPEKQLPDINRNNNRWPATP